MPKIKLDGIELNYEEHGGGEETVVFVHGFGGSTSSWRELQALLPSNYHTYALDIRGHGKSAQVTKNCTIAQFADDVYRFSRELGLGKFIYVGLSMGGRVGIQLAIEHSEVLEALVMVAPAPAHGQVEFKTPDEIKQALALWRNPKAIRALFELVFVRPISEARLQEWIGDFTLMEKEAFLSARDSSDHFNVETRLGEIEVPTLMLIGGKDNIIPPDEQWRTVKQIPGAKAVFFQDEGHGVTVENPQKVVSELTSFIAQLK